MQETVEISLDNKLRKQNGILASLMLGFWSLPFLAAWFVFHAMIPNASLVIIPVAGFWCSLIIRIHGRGLSSSFKIISYLGYLLLVMSAIALGAVATRGAVPLVIVLGLILAGFIGVSDYSRVKLPPEEDALYLKRKFGTEKTLKRYWRNNILLMIPALVLAQAAAFVAMVFITENVLPGTFSN
ncbi:hypothetical protein [Shewanella cyperi]|uniref:hypothetical protein n=1 Tax=Shewanella cyperi TaxID=2814292 RepID=UPI001A944E2C|nr:hypothetical protein [Shewanella cyperi]QSX39440.1 hypothetical protein JYB84_10295 [Shewanella cyperi]